MIRRLQPHELSDKHRSWVGNDDKGRHHQNQISRSESPLFIHLSWRVDSASPSRFIGCYELDMTGLLAAGYIREDGPDAVRLRFVHTDDGGIYVQARKTGPRIRVDTLLV